MFLTNVCIEAHLFLRKFIVRQGEREVGVTGGRGVHYLDDRRLLTAGLKDIIDCRTVLMSHRHASTVLMVSTLHRTIDISAREYKELFDTI
jgi:hypothetical protein